MNSGGSPANGNYDLKFSLFATNTTGTAIAGPVTNTATAVSNGLFTTTIDFGAGVFLGSSNWLEIAVSTNASNSFTTLAPRQQITPTPYAIYSTTAGSAATATTATTATSASSVFAANISGTILNSSLPTGVLTNGASGVNISGTFSGNGAVVTNLIASNLNSGVFRQAYCPAFNFHLFQPLAAASTMSSTPLTTKLQQRWAAALPIPPAAFKQWWAAV